MPTTSQILVGRINLLLEEKKYSLYKLHIKSGISYATLKSIMQGRTKSMDLNTIILIAYAFEMDVIEFLSGLDFKPYELYLHYAEKPTFSRTKKESNNPKS